MVTGIFSGVAVLLSGLFISNMEIQRRVAETQTMLGEMNYAMEYMTRTIRMAQNDEDGDCTDNDPMRSYGVSGDGSQVSFINHEGDCLRFFTDDGILKKGIREEGDLNFTDYALTSDALEIINFKIDLHEGDLHEDQPSVTVFWEAKIAEGEEDWQSVKAQTTVTRRGLDFEQ